MITKKYKIKIIEEINDDCLTEVFTSNDVVYVKPGIYAMSSRKLESLLRIADLPTLAFPTIAIKAVFGVFIFYPYPLQVIL